MKEEKSMVPTERDELERFGADPVVIPPVDIYENDEEVLLVADLPGVTPEDLDIDVDDGILRIRGRRVVDMPGGGEEQELGTADYLREFHVPGEIAVAEINARLADGVLRLHLPKSAPLRPRKVKVTAG